MTAYIQTIVIGLPSLIMKPKSLYLIIILISIFTFFGWNSYRKKNIFDAVNNSIIYEVNLRQYTPSGTIREFRNHLPRLKSMGIGIIWFMPIHPIGNINRKGSLGSYYSVKDYFDINPEFGTLNDFKSLIEEIHELDMFVILDWVANHTAWDNQLTEKFPEWYTKNDQGLFQSPPGTNWNDVIDLDYNREGLQDYMISAMEFWIEEFDIDGFRCDVASMVPIEFWEKLNLRLQKIKPVFMLAEANDSSLVKHAFRSDYNWELYHILKDIVLGEKSIASVEQYYKTMPLIYRKDALKMNFLDNHDENSWGRIMQDHFDSNTYPLMTLNFSLPGIPMLYSGQESKLDKQLKFFEKDTIQWKHYPDSLFYKKLINVRKNHPVFWSDNFSLNFLEGLPKGVLGLKRSKNNEDYFILLNLSSEPKRFNFNKNPLDVIFIDETSSQNLLSKNGYIIYKILDKS